MTSMLISDQKRDKVESNVLALQWAALTGNIGLVKFALDHGAPVNHAVNGFLPLQLACISCDNMAAVQYLIDRGADVNLQNKKGYTALHVASANGYLRIADLLLRNHAETGIKDKFGSTPLDIALARQDADMIDLLTTGPVCDYEANRQPSSEHGPLMSDWYGHGVVHLYEDDSYIHALERRAYRHKILEVSSVSSCTIPARTKSPLESFCRKSLELCPHHWTQFVKKHKWTWYRKQHS